MILFAGDAHGNFDPIIHASEKATAIILLGDQEPQNDLADELGPECAQKTWWIYGNHESDSPKYIKHHASMAKHNLHCQVLEVENIRIAGLGGIFRPTFFEVDKTTRLHDIDFTSPYDSRAYFTQNFAKKDIDPEIYTTIFADDLRALLQLQNIDILVTHEAPENHPMGYQLIGDVARKLNVKTIIHGHHHEYYYSSLGNIQVFGLDVAGAGSQEKPEGLLWWHSNRFTDFWADF